MKKYVKIKDFCGFALPSQKNNIIWFVQIKKIDNSKNNLGKSSKRKIGEHIPCRYLMSTIWAFDSIKNSLYCWEGCMKNVIINSKRVKIARTCNVIFRL